MDNFQTEIEGNQADFITKIYAWQGIALLVSAITAFKVSQNFMLVQQITNNPIILIVLIAAQLGFVLWLISNIKEFSPQKSKICFFIYAIANGLIIPLIFYYINSNFQIGVFLVLAGMFLLTSAFGYYSKQDLSSWFGLILMTIIGFCLDFGMNLFWRNDKTSLIISGIAILIFVGTTAYTFKNNIGINIKSNDETHKEPILGAFALYLNLFFLFIIIVMEANKSTKRINP